MTVELHEILWTVISSVGLVASVLNFWEARLDLRALYSANGLPLRIVALGNCRREALRTVAQALFTVIGVVALLTPSPSPPGVRSLTVFGLLLAALVLTMTSLVDRHDRLLLTAQLSRPKEAR